MNASALAGYLGSQEPTDSEATAREAWADSYTSFFEGALAGAVPVNVSALRTLPTPTTCPKAAFAGALAGFSSGEASAKLQGALGAFWAVLVASPPVFFPGATVITPPTAIAGLGVALEVTFSSNTADEKDKESAMTAIANDVFNASSGGTATFPGPSVVTIQ